MIRSIFAFVLILGITGSAVADVPPPPPDPGFKRVPYEIVVKLAAEMQDYRFFTFQRLGIGGEETIEQELKLSTEVGTPVPSNSSPSVRTGVVAVPATVMEELGTTEQLARLLQRDNQEKIPAGIVILETEGTTEDVRANDSRTKVVNVITVVRDEQAGVRFAAEPAPLPGSQVPTDTKLSDRTASRPPWGTLIAGITLAVAAASFGWLLFRRK